MQKICWFWVSNWSLIWLLSSKRWLHVSMPRNLGRWRLNSQRTRVHKFNESESSYNRQSAFVLLHKIRENVSMISCAYSLNLETWISLSRSVFRLLFMIRPLDITAVQKQPLLPAPVTTPQTPMAPSKSKKICYHDCQDFTNKNVNQQNRLHTSACLKKRLFTWSPTSTPRLTSLLSRIISSSTTYATKARKNLNKSLRKYSGMPLWNSCRYGWLQIWSHCWDFSSSSPMWSVWKYGCRI